MYTFRSNSVMMLPIQDFSSLLCFILLFSGLMCVIILLVVILCQIRRAVDESPKVHAQETVQQHILQPRYRGNLQNLGRNEVSQTRCVLRNRPTEHDERRG